MQGAGETSLAGTELGCAWEEKGKYRREERAV